MLYFWMPLYRPYSISLEARSDCMGLVFVGELGCAMVRPIVFQTSGLTMFSTIIIMTHSFIVIIHFLRALCHPTDCRHHILATFCRFHLSCVSLRAHLHFLHPEDVGQWRHGWTSLAIAYLRRWWATIIWHWYLWTSMNYDFWQTVLDSGTKPKRHHPTSALSEVPAC